MCAEPYDPFKPPRPGPERRRRALAMRGRLGWAAIALFVFAYSAEVGWQFAQASAWKPAPLILAASGVLWLAAAIAAGLAALWKIP